jgi:hypothetical protein
MLFRKSTPKARFAGWAFVDLIVLFAVISTVRPVVGLAGLGAVMVLGSILVEANHDMIWQTYKKNYKKTKDPVHEMFHRPNEVYNKLNVYVLWPVLFALGLGAIYAAYWLAV